MIAHQKLQRDKIALEASDDLFGDYWRDINTDISNAVVKETTRETAQAVIEKYEWLGCLAAVSYHYYGIFFDNVCAGVVCYGPEYSENLGHWSKFGYEGKMILLNRGACVHWAHPHSASKLIRGSMKMLPDKYEVVTCTVDDLAGEIGTIYQACGFHYVGSMRDNNCNVHSRKGDRDGWLVNGKLYGSRNLRSKIGTTKIEEVRKLYPDVVKVKQNSKGRYFAFRGNKKVKRERLAAIKNMVKPYPKRLPSD